MGQDMDGALRGRALSVFADMVCEELLGQGFILHRYDAHSTNSIYLKLDFGVCNSIRISDHGGKGYLKYRYNIGTDIREERTEMDKWPRHYYPIRERGAMVAQIVADRDAKKKRYGECRYQGFMAENQKAHARDKGFWAQSRRVL